MIESRGSRVALTVLLAVGLGAVDGAAGTHVVTSTSDSGPGTLRDAIQSANAGGGPDLISFNLSLGPAGVAVIQPLSALPALTDADTIVDARTQPGYAGAPLVVLDGSLCPPGSDGFRVGSDRCEIHALCVHSFSGAGIRVEETGGNVTASTTILGANYIGTAPDGMTAAPNGVGVRVAGNAALTRIGFGEPTANVDPNVISGNEGPGVVIEGVGTATSVWDNLIGVGNDGLTPVPNRDGVEITTPSSNVGPADVRENVIAGNTLHGVEILGARGVLLRDNLIGVAADDVATAVPNGLFGVYVSGSPHGHTMRGNTIAANAFDGIHVFQSPGGIVEDNIVGAAFSSLFSDLVARPNGGHGIRLEAVTGGSYEDNDVRSNAFDGIFITGASSGVVVKGGALRHNGRDGFRLGAGVHDCLLEQTVITGNGGVGGALDAGAGNGNRITRNSIAGNDGIGIDLGLDGITYNDPDDGDAGPNRGQNHPVLVKAWRDGANVHVIGMIDSVAGFSTYPLTVELFEGGLPAREGEVYLGSASVATGPGTFEAVVGVTANPDYVTATLTDAGGNTSEFSAPIGVLDCLGTGVQVIAMSGMTPADPDITQPFSDHLWTTQFIACPFSPCGPFFNGVEINNAETVVFSDGLGVYGYDVLTDDYRQIVRVGDPAAGVGVSDCFLSGSCTTKFTSEIDGGFFWVTGLSEDGTAQYLGWLDQSCGSAGFYQELGLFEHPRDAVTPAPRWLPLLPSHCSGDVADDLDEPTSMVRGRPTMRPYDGRSLYVGTDYDCPNYILHPSRLFSSVGSCVFAQAGDPAPGSGSEVFDRIYALSSSGTAVFFADVVNPITFDTRGIVARTFGSGSVDKIASAGDAVPFSPGGRLAPGFGTASTEAWCTDGGLTYLVTQTYQIFTAGVEYDFPGGPPVGAPTAGIFASSSIFLSEAAGAPGAGADDGVITFDTTLQGCLDGTLRDFRSLHIGGVGPEEGVGLYFTATLSLPETGEEVRGIFVFDHVRDRISKVVLQGDPLPAPHGGLVYQDFFDLDVNGLGQLVFEAVYGNDPHSSTTGGGVFLATFCDDTCDCPGEITSYGSGCAGAGGFVPRLVVEGCPTGGGLLRVYVEGGLGGSVATLFVGLTTAQTPIGPNCDLLVAPAVLNVPLPLGGAAPGEGSIEFFANLPPATPPSMLTLQAFVLDAAAASGLAATQGVKMVIE